MASPLETLPTELLDIILGLLADRKTGCICGKILWATLSRLCRCSKILSYRIQPVLYNAPHAKNLVLRHGCATGNGKAIIEAVARASNPSAVRVCCEQYSNLGYSYSSYREYSSLNLAVVGKQLGVFRLLLNLGASITPHDFRKASTIDTQTKMFVELMGRKENVVFLEAFIDARSTTPYWKDSREDNCSQAEFLVRQLNFSNFVLSEPIALLERMATNGAHLNEAFLVAKNGNPRHLRYLTPLSAACLRGDFNVFNLLVASGAREDIKLPDLDRTPQTIGNPETSIFSAMRYMARTGRTDLLQRCLAAGADINRPCHDEMYDDILQPDSTHKCSTPFLTFLEAVPSWDNSCASNTYSQRLSPSAAVEHLIVNCGAKVPSPSLGHRSDKGYGWNHTLRTHLRFFGGIPAAMELLMMRHGVLDLELPGFSSAINLLIQHGGIGPDLARLLVLIDGPNPADEEPTRRKMEQLWQQFLALIMPRLKALDQTTKNNLLRKVIVDKGAQRTSIHHPSHWIKVRAMGQATITTLIRAGGNIDERTVGGWMNVECTPLHEVVGEFVRNEILTWTHMHDHPPGTDCPYTEDFVDAFSGYLAFIVSKSANYRKYPATGRRVYESTPIDTLWRPIENKWFGCDGGAIETALERFATVVRGADGTTAKSPWGEGIQMRAKARAGWARPFWWKYDRVPCDEVLP